MELRSKEYIEFLEEEKKAQQLTLYEKLCKISEKISVSPPQDLGKQYREAIDFCHLKITPKGAFSLAVFSSLIIFFIPLVFVFLFATFSISVVIFISFITFFVFYYLYDYPLHLSIMYRIKASAEMVLAVLYMTIAMRINPNLEHAVKFASKNLSGPLAFDLRQVLWDVYTRKYDSMTDALNAFIRKWKRENEEFTQAVYLVQTSVLESTTKRDKALDEAVSVILTGTKERMKHYAQELRTPVTVLNALGILLPIIGLIFFPMIAIFMPEAVRPTFLIISYNFFLPVIVYWMMKTYLEKRPATFHQPDVSKHPQFMHEKFLNKNLLLSAGIALVLISFGAYKILQSTELFSFSLLVYSLLITIGITSGIVLYSILSVLQKLKLREEIVQIEGEFAEVLFQLGNQLTRGIPIEAALKETSKRTKDLKTSKMFKIILHNIEGFGMTFEQAVFDKNYGAINFYPSKLIEAVMRAIVEISKKGMSAVSIAMISISAYLKDVHSTEEEAKDILSEVTSNMDLQALLLAPLSSGIVVALTAIVTKMLVSLQSVVDKMFKSLGGYGPVGTAGSGILSSVINLSEIIKIQHFQLIVAVYMIEVVGMIAVFSSIIKNGDESLLKRLNVGKMVATSVVIYAVVLILVYTLFGTLVPETFV